MPQSLLGRALGLPTLVALTLTLHACDSSGGASAATADGASAPPPAPEAYPETRTGDASDVYHGSEVADPYRWLEDDIRESDEVAAWVAAQNEVTDAYLSALPAREWFADRLEALWDYERFDLPRERGGRYFYLRNDGTQDQSVLYVADSVDGEPRVLLDPNTWSDDGTVALAEWAPSPDGSHLAYGIQDGGSDWRTWRVVDVESGVLLDDEVQWIKYTAVSWSADGTGFFYSRYPAPAEGARFQSPNLNRRVYFHALGTEQADDPLIYERPDQPEWSPNAEVSSDGRYLVVTIGQSTDNRYRVAYLDLTDAGASVQTLVDEFTHDYTFIDHRDGDFFFYTNEDAPRYRVIAIPLESPDQRREIIPERDAALQGVTPVGEALVASYLEDARSAVRVYERDGSLRDEIELPGLGSVGAVVGGPRSSEAFFSFSSFNRPGTLFRYDVATGETTTWRSADVEFDPDDYVVRQVFVRSRDGTRIPLFLAHRADVTPDGTTPSLLYGYGGFNISIPPAFAVQNLAWMDAGGVYAHAILRGGGEYGREWHDAGKGINRQNVFDDFIAAAEYLVAAGISSPDHIASYGRSNGGLLVGATLNQRPDLFAVALPAVGVMDMVRFNRFTAGRFWVDDYGSPEDSVEFAALYEYSPIHNIQPGVDYPPILVTTADMDDRVVPGHSFKYAATLQGTETGSAPTLIRIESRGGHGAGTATSALIDLYADQWAFIAAHTGLNPN